MHLAQGLTTTKTSKRKQKKLTPKDIQDYTVAWRAHNKDCRKRYLHSMQFDTVEAYIDYARGNIKVAKSNKGNTKVAKINAGNTNVAIPSHAASVGNCFKTEPHVYSGDRKLVGIAVMHKSNLVPIFEDEEGGARQEATELANMGK